MKVRIYKKPRNINQSGPGVEKWLIEFPSISGTGLINSVMGWKSSSDMLAELGLSFPDQDAAISFAKLNNWDFEIIERKERKIIKKSYADNFQ